MKELFVTGSRRMPFPIALKPLQTEFADLKLLDEEDVAMFEQLRNTMIELAGGHPRTLQKVYESLQDQVVKGRQAYQLLTMTWRTTCNE